MKRLISLIMFFFLAWNYGQNSIVGYEYWFDNNYYEKVNTIVAPVPILTINASVATPNLVSGIHTFNIRSWDTNGLFSSTLSSFFYKVPEQSTVDRNIVNYEYWFDNDYANRILQTANNQQTFTLNTNVASNALVSGIHTFNIRFKDNTGFSSSTLSGFFYKIPENAIVDRKIVKYEYWYDNDYANKVSETANNQETFTLNNNIVPTALANGIHTFNIRFIDNTQLSSSTLSNFFYKNPNGSITLRNIVEYEYWFNDDYSNKTSITITPMQTAIINTFIIPENSGLGLGTHQLNMRFKDDSNLWSSISTDEFNLSTLDISDNNLLKNIVLYPNPTNGYLNIELNQVYTEINIKVFDIRGIEVYHQNNQNTDKTEIHLGLASGIYFVNLTADGNSSTHKIIKR